MSRSHAYRKSLALIGCPLEYFRLGRSLKVSVLPPLEIVGRLWASAGTILAPAVPWTPRTNVSSGVLMTEYSSLPCVVKSRPWSADSGAVPDAIVIVPPLWPLDDDDDDDGVEVPVDVFFDEPQAATARAAPRTATVTRTALNFRIEFLLLRGLGLTRAI